MSRKGDYTDCEARVRREKTAEREGEGRGSVRIHSAGLDDDVARRSPNCRMYRRSMEMSRVREYMCCV